ncbi:MAG: hypothetical protein IPJ85_00575 [Flavobacteriales bacterium]|nr:hypothetical protein [Flavobacteriales bacterium]
MILQWLSAMRWYVMNLSRWLRMGRGSAIGQKTAHIDIERNLWHRYLHILILFLQMSGYRVELRHRWRFMASWASSDLFRMLKGLSLVGHGPRASTDLVISDRKDIVGALVLDADYFDPLGTQPHGYRIPMPMADSAYLLGVHERAPEIDAPREHAIFFFGNMDRSAYARSEPRTLFGCMDRCRLLDLIRNELPHRVHEPMDESSLAARGSRDIVLMDRTMHYIKPKDLPSVLARFDFFLAPSGVIMPLCHNLVEAMFAGCIPILQHPHLMDPPLIDGVNCLSFHDETSLVPALDRAKDLSASEVFAMRRAVRSYYDEHLAPAPVVQRLEAQKQGYVRLNAELASVRMLDRKIRATVSHEPVQPAS